MGPVLVVRYNVDTKGRYRFRAINTFPTVKCPVQSNFRCKNGSVCEHDKQCTTRCTYFRVKCYQVFVYLVCYKD